jgi:predicted ATPase
MRENMQLYVTRLRLANWRNFKKVDIRLTRRAFFVGPNASGKSNLLDALKFLRNLVSVGGGLQAAVQDREGISGLRCLAARNNSAVMVGVDIGDEECPAQWQYEIEFNGRRKEDFVTIKREVVWRDGVEILFRPDKDDKKDDIRLQETAIERKSSNREFRDLEAFFASIRYLHLVPQVVRDPERRSISDDDALGSDFLERLAGSNKNIRSSRLKRINQALRVAVPQLTQLKMEQDNKGLWHLKANVAHWRPQGAWQDERSFSDGTLRLLGILWAIVEPGGPLILEEPELSLHPGVVERIPAMFHHMQQKNGRQVLITTHSEKLLQDNGIGLDEIHMLIPGSEATDVVACSDREDIQALVEGGLPPGEAVMPKVAPPKAHQLSLLDLG